MKRRRIRDARRADGEREANARRADGEREAKTGGTRPTQVADAVVDVRRISEERRDTHVCQSPVLLFRGGVQAICDWGGGALHATRNPAPRAAASKGGPAGGLEREALCCRKQSQ